MGRGAKIIHRFISFGPDCLKIEKKNKELPLSKHAKLITETSQTTASNKIKKTVQILEFKVAALFTFCKQNSL